MATMYADMFEYETFVFIMNTSMIEYTNVKLLKDMCGKKAGSEIDKIVLNPANGVFTIHKTKKTLPQKKKPNVVEFKGVHTRFEDSDESLDKDDDLVYIPNEVKSSTFKFYEGRKKVTNIHDDLFEEFKNFINDLGSGSRDIIVINNTDELIRVAGIDLESRFEVKKRHKLPSGKYSFVRVF